MTAEQITTILSSLGVIGFLWIWVRALKKQISEMNKTIEVQKNTLEELKKQISEMDKTIEVQKNTLEELKKQISEMNKTIEVQKNTLEELKKQISEMNKTIEVQKNSVEALKMQFTKMNKTIEVQQKTLEAMKTQVSETEKVGSIYRQFIEELPSEIEKYKLELKQRALDDIPALIAQFEEIATTIEQRLSTVDQLVNHIPSHRPATWKWLSAFSTIEPNLLLIHSDNEDTEEEPNNKAD